MIINWIRGKYKQKGTSLYFNKIVRWALSGLVLGEAAPITVNPSLGLTDRFKSLSTQHFYKSVESVHYFKAPARERFFKAK